MMTDISEFAERHPDWTFALHAYPSTLTLLVDVEHLAKPCRIIVDGRDELQGPILAKVRYYVVKYEAQPPA